jgi:hypothetical protein
MSRAGIGTRSRASKVGVVSAPLVGRAGWRSSTGRHRWHRSKAGGGQRVELWRGSGQRRSGRARGRARVGGYARDRANASRRVRLFFFNTKVPHLDMIFSFQEPLGSAPFEPNTIEMELGRSAPLRFMKLLNQMPHSTQLIFWIQWSKHIGKHK